MNNTFKTLKKILVAVCFALAITLAFGVSENVAAKSKVKITYKKGTVTVKGKGAMPKVKIKKKKIKKVVIKKGVTSIPKNAFKKCTKLKKVKIASTVKKIGARAFYKTAIKKLVIPKKTTKLGKAFIDNCSKLKNLTIPSKFTMIETDGKIKNYRNRMRETLLDNVTFNTNFDLGCAGYFRTKSFTTSSKDPKYKSYNGVVYTKDGKELVRVPSMLPSYSVRNGCELFDCSAILYDEKNGGGNPCKDLKNIELPNSVSEITLDKYKYRDEQEYDRRVNFTFHNNALPTKNFILLKNTFKISPYRLMQSFPERVKKTSKLYIVDNKCVIDYIKGANITKEDLKGIEIIGEKSFDQADITTIELPDTLTEIEPYAFYMAKMKKIDIPDSVKIIGEGAFHYADLTEVIWPKGISKIEDMTFYCCYDLQKITFRGPLVELGDAALDGKNLDINSILGIKTLTTLGEGSLDGIGSGTIVVPDHIIKAKANALHSYKANRFVVQGYTQGFDREVFGGFGEEEPKITLVFSKGIGQAFTNADIDYGDKGTKTYYQIKWHKVTDVDGYQIVFAKDKGMKKKVQRFTASKNDTTKTISINYKKAKKLKYYAVRPYKVENKVKKYGRLIPIHL